MSLTIDYPYAGFILTIEVDASEAEPQTLEEPGCDAEFCITEIKLNGVNAEELIGFSGWTSGEQFDFEFNVEAYYIETECGEE